MNNFIWVDLSTFDLPKAQRFYGSVLGWSFETDEAGYSNASPAGAALPTAGLYPMPAFFRKIKMPSFWMSYIRVADIDAVLAKAEELGAKIELQEDNALGRIALVRDPLGAGFTCIQSDTVAPGHGSAHGQTHHNELVNSDLSRIQPFYQGVFGWSLESLGSDRYTIRNAEGTAVGSVQVVPNEIKGDKEYWAVHFAAADLAQAKQAVEAAGGSVVYQYDTEVGSHLVAHDDQGAAFTLTALKRDRVGTTRLATESASATPQIKPALKWRAAIGLVGVYLIVLLGLDWAWGLLFLFWVVPDLKTGVTYFIEPVTRDGDTLLYWAIVGTWLALSAYLLITPLLG